MLKSLFKRIRIFILCDILKKNYIRTGKCKGCGKCCSAIYVRHSKNVIQDEQEFENLKFRHFFFTYLKVIDKDEIGLVFECTKLDKEAGRCTAYNSRSYICRNYPQEELFMMGGEIAEHCGYRFVPIKSFEEVLHKVQKNKNNKAFFS